MTASDAVAAAALPKSPHECSLLLQSDTEDLPLDVDLRDSQQRAALYAQLGPLADPTTALRPTEGADGGAHAPAL